MGEVPSSVLLWKDRGKGQIAVGNIGSEYPQFALQYPTIRRMLVQDKKPWLEL